MTIHSRAFSRSDLPDWLPFVSHVAAHRWPRMSHLHIGDVVWQCPGSQPKENIRLWFDDDRLAGYAWFQPPDVVRFDVDPTLPDSLTIRSEALAWATTRRTRFPASEPFYLSLQSMDHFEPFGTHPDWRGTGTSRALLFEMFRRAEAKGVLHVRIYTAGFNHQAISLYTSCGLSLVDRCRTFRKPLFLGNSDQLAGRASSR